MKGTSRSGSCELSMFLVVFSVVVLVALGVLRAAWCISFEMHCDQYLKRAADANTVELAKANLAKALKYIENNNLTDGVVSVFLKQPKNDIGFWYSNLKSSLDEL